MASRVLSRIPRSGFGHHLILAATARQGRVSDGFHSLRGPMASPPVEIIQLLQNSILRNNTLQRFGFFSSASPHSSKKEPNQSPDKEGSIGEHGKVFPSSNSAKSPDGFKAPEQTEDAGSISEHKHSVSQSQSVKKRRRSPKRTVFSDSDVEAEVDLSIDDLVKLVAEKEKLLKIKHKEIEKMQDKVLRSYADMENVIERTKREAENSKKFAVQNFAKSLLDVADNLARASSVVKESFQKIDSSKDSAGAVPLLKTLLEGVEMTDKQLTEVFRKFGVEKFDPTNEHFDPHRHHAVFQIPDASKLPGTVAAVLKPGYMLYDRVIRPAEVGVTVALNDEADRSS